MVPVSPTAQRSPGWRRTWRGLRRDRIAMTALTGFLVLALCCLVGPWMAQRFGLDATTMRYDLGATSPSRAHWLGTDTQGRDMLVRVMLGGRIAIAVALLTTAIAVLIGVGVGAVAAYAGGSIDHVMMRAVDALYGLPIAALVIVVMAVLHTRSLIALVAVMAALSWFTLARIVRAQVRSLRHREFVDAARALGASPARILFRHIVPNTIGVVVVYATLALPQVMLAESFLSFLGLGVQAPLASLGTLVTEGSSHILVYPWLLLGPALVMALLVLTLTFMGDRLHDALDLQGRRDSSG
jgi:oligopeptide transport system permease protein